MNYYHKMAPVVKLTYTDVTKQVYTDKNKSPICSVREFGNW